MFINIKLIRQYSHFILVQTSQSYFQPTSRIILEKINFKNKIDFFYEYFKKLSDSKKHSKNKWFGKIDID